MFAYARSQASKTSSALETNCPGLPAEVLWRKFGWAPRKAAPLPGVGCRWLGSVGLPVLRTGGRCSRSVSAGCPAGSPKQFMVLLELEIKISLNELCVLVSFKGL